MLRLVFLVLAVSLASGCACHGPSQQGALCASASDCVGELVCGFGTCRTPCTTGADCEFGMTCLLDAQGHGACSTVIDQGCASGQHPCASGLSCVADRCERACISSADCPSDRACLATSSGGSFCLDPSGSDAGPSDASPHDAAGDASRDAGPARRRTIVGGCIGTTSACVLANDHAVYCWGDATCTGAAHAPTQILGDVDIVACGDGFACAHGNDGLVRCWGRNDLGQLGRNGTSTCEATPAPVVDGDGPISVSAADLVAAGAHACVLTIEGDLSCWGRNDGALDVRSSADPSTTYTQATDALVPMRDAPGNPLARGMPATIALSAHGVAARQIASRDLYLWGLNDHLETSGVPGVVTTAVRLVAAGRGTSTTAGRFHRCAIDAGGAICWGDDGLGQLGHAPSAAAVACGSSMCEGPGAAMGSFTRIAASGDGDTTCGLVSPGRAVRCWGDNAHGLAGVDPAATPIAYLDDTVPEIAFPAATLTPFSLVFVGPSAACVIDASASAWCWGDHDLDASTADLTTPAVLTLP